MVELQKALGALFITNLGLIVTLFACTWKVSAVVTKLQLHVDILMKEHDRRMARAEEERNAN